MPDRRRSLASPEVASWRRAAAEMLAMEGASGLRGVVAAPIYYAYLKQELAARGLV